MRYYSIVLTNPTTGQIIRPSGFTSLPATYTSFINGKTIPNAWNVELDIPVTAFAEPLSQDGTGAVIRIWGISLKEISQASNLNGSLISVYAGMQKGLPLANPKQAGLIMQGYVFQAFGNWIGTDMTLDLICFAGTAGTGTVSNAKNLVLNWTAGMELSVAIKNTLSSAFPTLKSNINIKSGLVLASDQKGFYQTVGQLASLIKNISAGIIGGNYAGVSIILDGNTFNVYDGSTQAAPKQINFQDLIGQPTWIQSPSIQVKTVMRADISVGDFIKLPQTITTNTAQSQSQARNSSAFQGSFLVNQVRHIGNFRQPDGDSWATTIDAAPVPQ